MPVCKLAGAWQNIRERAARRKGEVVPESLMRFHLLAPEVKCPVCGADLTFIRVRRYCDLYQCASCKCHVVHYRNRTTKTCGYAGIAPYGSFGAWTRVVKESSGSGVKLE
jgi:hypothetical protein